MFADQGGRQIFAPKEEAEVFTMVARDFSPWKTPPSFSLSARRADKIHARYGQAFPYTASTLASSPSSTTPFRSMSHASE